MPTNYQNTRKHFINPFQLSYSLTRTNEFFAVVGRGSSKTSGITAQRIDELTTAMPRSSGAIVARTYQQLFTRILPSLLAGLEKRGLVRNRHYIIGKPPPNGFVSPFESPLHYQYYITFCNGAGMHLISQDVKDSANSLNLDWVVVDEAKFLNYNKYIEQVKPAIRANVIHFGSMPLHLSECMVTSMPDVVDGEWIWEKQKQYLEKNNKDKVDLLLSIGFKIMQLDNEIYKQTALHTEGKRNKTLLQQLNDKYDYWENMHDALRGECINFVTGSTLQANLSVLGEKYFINLIKSMPAEQFNSEILNIRPRTEGTSFYPNLDIDKHAYTNFNNGKIDDLNYDFSKRIDCRYDRDCHAAEPLYISVDWGAQINCMTVAQLIEGDLYFINSMYVKSPEFMDHLASKFTEYYEGHGAKHVMFTYDVTGNTHMANSQMTYAQQFSGLLFKKGWTVSRLSKGRAPMHRHKYALWHKLLAESGTGPRIRFNFIKARSLINSMMNCSVKKNKDDQMQKDKSKEQKKNYPQENAPHLSDAADAMVWYLYHSKLNDSTSEYIPLFKI